MIKRMVISLGLAIFCFFFLFGQSTFAQVSKKGYRSIELLHKGHIRGKVRYTGPAMELPEIEITKDPNVCGSQPRKLKAIDISGDGALRNAVVYIADITRGKPFSPVAGPPVLEQKGCAYYPHVQVVPGRSTLKIVNEDKLWHNVHAYLFPYDTQFVLYPSSLPGGGRTLFNAAMLKFVKKIFRDLPEKGIVKFMCDAGHTWMTAYIVLAEHPYFAKVDQDGRFELKDVPVGTYELAVWHEYFGTKTKDIEIFDNTYTRVDFVYKQGSE
ncbi:MAG: carboxypeptidase regulatory-like domain-containing protein [bacterium]